MPRSHHIVDCTTLKTTERAFTPDEEAAHDTLRDERRAIRAKKEQDDADLKAAVAASGDPVVRALAARLGLA